MSASQARPSSSSDLSPASYTPTRGEPGAQPHQITVLLYSDDVATRDAVRLGVGRRPAKDVEVIAWREVATPAAAVAAAEQPDVDVMILDGESSPIGGLGLAKQLKNEIFDCAPILVLTGRPQDGWLAAWSQADLAVPHPIDPVALSRAVAELGRRAAPASA